ncbi:OmpA family protein [Polaromonas sp. CT11-55]|uniref:OmpA family protein n=1 Tax=Polaromonas sp. CT11-55 TaxID=3243045 RepID=UPI0039A4110F
MRTVTKIFTCVVPLVLLGGCIPRVPPGCNSLVEKSAGAIHVKGLTIPVGSSDIIKLGEGEYTPAARQTISDAILRVNEYRLAQCNLVSLLLELKPQPVDKIAAIGDKIAKSNELILQITEDIRKNPDSAKVVEGVKTKEAELPKDEKGAGLPEGSDSQLKVVHIRLGELTASVNENSRKLETLATRGASPQEQTQLLPGKFSVTGFAVGASTLTPAMRKDIVTQFGRLMQAAPKAELLQFDVVGYADSSGSYLHNLQLGLARAHSVGTFLQAEVSGKRSVLRTVTSAGSAQGGADARRVEVYVLSI